MLFEKKKAKLEKKFGGIKTLQRVPNAIFVINDAIHSTAIKEAAKLNIPIIGICDTNSDPDLITYPIPANDDAIKSIHVIALALLSVFEPSLLTRIDEVLTKKFETEGETTPTDETVNKTTEKKEESIN
jgi:small subunit ribosomal protein S2